MMRFIKFATSSGLRVGVLKDGVVSIAEQELRLEDHFGDDGEALQRLGTSILATPAAEAQIDTLQLVRPVDPVSIRDFMIFEEHVLPSWRQSGLARGPDVWYQQPIGYFGNVAGLLGPSDSVELPGGSLRLDFELEVAAVIGRATRSVTPEHAGGAVAGFLIFCDWSARDVQFQEMAGFLGPFKGKDFASSLGPYFVTPDELADRRDGTGYDLLMTSKVNDRFYGSDRWSSAYWSFEELISYASWNSCVDAGSLIGSGTCQGGCIQELSVRHGGAEYPWLAAGDVVSLEIERLGAIKARIDPPARGGWPGLRTLDA
jgi:2-keto-4-pentenoate hydratase/2-oxohepta-3-ene-1,7-dioic acid hydratase in catechol pathway